ncbi:MAG: PAS domain S-box protein [Halorhabdus sp.]
MCVHSFTVLMASTPDKRAFSVLLVTADREFATACESYLPELHDIDISTVESVGAAIDVLVSGDRLDCIISDHNLPDTDGVAFLEAVRAQAPTLPFILFTSEGSEEVASRAISADVTEYLIKELHSNQWERLAALIRSAVTFYRKRGDLLESEYRAKTLLDAADDVIAVIRDGRVGYINKAGVHLTEAETRDAVLGQPVDEVLLTGEGFSLRDQLAVVQRREVTFDHEQRHLKRPDSERLPVELTATAAEWIGGPAVVLIMRDISERKVRERDQRLNNLAMDNAPIGITIADADEPDYPLTFVNEQFEQLTGYSAEEVIGKNCRFLQGDGTDPEPVTQMREAIEAEEPVTVEVRNYRKDDTEFWNRVTIAPIRNDAGDVINYVGFQEDVTDAKERERAREETSAVLSTLFETLPAGVLVEDASRNVLTINQRLLELYEFPGETADVIGEDCKQLAEQVSDMFVNGEGFVERINEIVANQNQVDNEELPLVDGRTFERSYRPIKLPDGDGHLWVYRDITERKEDERVLRRFRRAVEAAGHAIYITDTDGTITYVNPAFEQSTGYDSAEAVGQTSHILNSGEMSDEYYDRMWSTISSGDIWDEEIVDRRASGESYHARQTIAPVTGENGVIEAFVAIQTDISEQKEHEQTLQQYEYAIESANDLIAAVDDEYRFLFANPAYREFYDLGEGDVTERTLRAVVGEETWETIQPYVEQEIAGNYVHFEMTRSQPDQPERSFDIRYYPLERVDDEILGTMAVMRDITERRERERQLESLDRMLRHTLHNQLNIIMGRAELIAEHTTGQVADWADLIQRVGDRLIEQADKQREIVEFLSEPSTAVVLDLVEIVAGVVDRMETTHPEATISVDAPETLSLTSIPELERAVVEVVENAIIHTDQMPPEVAIRVAERDETIEISVADNGPGIPDTERRVIAEDAKIEPLLHSNGMGLWLVKRILTSAGGAIRFEETDSRGNTVTLVVPRRPSGNRESASADA